MADPETIKRQKPKATAVVMIGAFLVLGNWAIYLSDAIDKMQVKSHSPGGIDYFDFAKLVVGSIGSITLGAAAYMNQSYGRYEAKREKHETQMLERTDTEWIRQELEKGKKPA